MTDLRIDYDAALKAYDEHGGKHSEALRAALDAGVHLAVIQMRAIEEYADSRDDHRDRIIETLDEALGVGSCVERDITDAIRQLTQERDTYRDCARAASMYLPEPERTNFRRQYGLPAVTL